jgi:hypothetical protein
MTKGTLMFFQKTRGSSVALTANILMILRELTRILRGLVYQLLQKDTKKSLFQQSYVNFTYLLQHLIGVEKEI